MVRLADIQGNRHFREAVATAVAQVCGPERDVAALPLVAELEYRRVVVATWVGVFDCSMSYQPMATPSPPPVSVELIPWREWSQTSLHGRVFSSRGRLIDAEWELEGPERLGELETLDGLDPRVVLDFALACIEHTSDSVDASSREPGL